VSSRQIERLWTEQEVINEAALAARKARADEARSTAARRAGLAKRIDSGLADNGVEARPTSAPYGEVKRGALKAAGFEFTDDGQVWTRLTDLYDWMSRGDLAEKDAAVLLANVGTAVS
jgi:hypothetical protein